MNESIAVSEPPAVARWRERFVADTSAALGVALTGTVSLGPYDRARPAEALAQILREAELSDADKGVQTWLAGLLGLPKPADLSGRRFSDALVDTFRLIALLDLSEARAWCVQHHSALRTWLRGFYLGHSRDPEAALLVALAQQQADRSLLPLWQGIVRRGRPLMHVRHALSGLRLLPADDTGAVERGVPRALLQGLLDFGDALARQGDRKGCDWLMEIDFLAVVYPLSMDSWGRRFREVVQTRRPAATVRNWLDQRYPLALKAYDIGAHQGALQPPYFPDIEPTLQQVNSNFQEVAPRLRQFVDDSRHYCRESGDSYYLVRSFCNIADRLLDCDPAWARDLAHEATVWAPGNPRTWSVLARALEAEGDWRRAEAIYWQAGRRFPENVQSHSQLAHALLIHGSGDLGEAVYRQAIPLFPDNPICRNDLGHTLRVLGRYDEALAEYRQAQELFHRDVVVANSIADLLVDMKRLDEAVVALDWAEQIAPADDYRSQQMLARIGQRLRSAQAGQPIIPRKLAPRREVASGSLAAFSDIAGDLAYASTLGEATLLRRKANGGLARAHQLIAALPEGPDKLIELGLWEAVDKGWPTAAAWFEDVWQRYEGDGVLRVHRQRARARAGETVDWSSERAQYPDLLAVILTEERGAPPQSDLPDDDDSSQEQLQDSWLRNLVSRQDATLRDRAEEDYLAARHLL